MRCGGLAGDVCKGRLHSRSGAVGGESIGDESSNSRTQRSTTTRIMHAPVRAMQLPVQTRHRNGGDRHTRSGWQNREGQGLAELERVGR